ncbi:MAG: NusG domain II-containing protein [Ruminococcus sp.]|nr:NusG domain II-containing protein [Ruminococcus sp.]
MPDRVKIIIVVVAVIFIGAAAATFVLFGPGSEPDKGKDEPLYVEIVRDGRVIEKLDLNSEKDRTFRIEDERGWNEVTIKDGRISITDADCPDHTCVKTGELRSEYVPIVCLPHKLMIRFAE